MAWSSLGTTPRSGAFAVDRPPLAPAGGRDRRGYRRVPLLQAAFTSWRLAALAFVTLPVALAGGLVAAVVAGGTLAGVVAGMRRSSARRTQRDPDGPAVPEPGREYSSSATSRRAGTRERLRPSSPRPSRSSQRWPFAFAGEIAGLEIVRLMAVVMLGGVFTRPSSR
jgi:hypothetical protein